MNNKDKVLKVLQNRLYQIKYITKDGYFISLRRPNYYNIMKGHAEEFIKSNPEVTYELIKYEK